MAVEARSVTWEAPAHHHTEKTSDWFWALGIIAISGSVAALFFGNLLLAILVILGALIMGILASREPEMTSYAVTTRGLRVGERLYPFGSLEAYYIDEDEPTGPQLLARSQHMFAQLVIMPLPEDAIEEIEHILESRLPEEHIEEPFGTKLLEIFGF